MSSADHSDRIRDLFDQVVGLEPEERTAYLAEACGDDQELRRKVESLLEAADARGSGVRRALEGMQPSEDTDQERSAPMRSRLHSGPPWPTATVSCGSSVVAAASGSSIAVTFPLYRSVPIPTGYIVYHYVFYV
jgi:hypothetical protein